MGKGGEKHGTAVWRKQGRGDPSEREEDYMKVGETVCSQVSLGGLPP